MTLMRLEILGDKVRSKDFLILARLVKYVQDEALKKISSAELRQRVTAHANRLTKVLDDADQRNKWRPAR